MDWASRLTGPTRFEENNRTNERGSFEGKVLTTGLIYPTRKGSLRRGPMRLPSVKQ
jgi:hypothetical protein